VGQTPQPERTFLQRILALVFASDGKMLAMGSSNKTVEQWDVAARQERGILRGLWLSRSFAHAKLSQEDKAADTCAQAVEHSKVIRLQKHTLWTGRIRSAAADSWQSWERIVADCTNALDKGTVDWWLWRGRGLAHAALGQWDKAASDFTRASELMSDDAEVWQGLGRAHAELDQWDQAATAWSKALARKPAAWSVWYLRGMFQEERALQYPAAVRDFSKVLSLGIDEWIVRYRRGFAYAELGQWDKAAADFAKVPWLELRELDPPAWQLHALALLASGDTHAYRSACARLLERFGQTEDPNTANHVAWTCVLGPGRVADIDPCIPLMKKAVARVPNYYCLKTLGAALYRAGQFEAAIQQLKEAHKRHGKTGPDKSLLFLALTQHCLGRTDEARQTLDKIVPWGKQATQGRLQDKVDRFEYQLLRREAEELMKGEKP
jgi:tetratricopeptide (TPR) repeat protein